MNREQVIAIYGSHDASITFIDKDDKLRVYEYERYVKKRYSMLSSTFDYRQDLGSNQQDRISFLSQIKSNLKNENILLILHLEINEEDKRLLLSFFPNAEFKLIGHHLSHAASGFYPSGYKEALVMSVDGGGWDNGFVSMTNVYNADQSKIELIATPKLDLGNPYSGIGFLISEVSPSPEPEQSVHALSYAGKIMGLCGYGTVREEWLDSMNTYYTSGNLQQLCNELGIEYKYNSLSGKDSYDLSATSQYVFEQKMDVLVNSFWNDNKKNIVLVGGCALNVLYNQKLKEHLSKEGFSLYVPPNPNDCGLSYGMLLLEYPELAKEEVHYSGVEILDKNNLENLLHKYEYKTYEYSDIVELLKQGKIIGVIQDNSEVGPRALGNRSIICDPSIDGMKDTLNAKVKFREWFRPFAPVCRIEDMEKYFLQVYESKYMSYAPIVKEDYRESLKTVTHVDGTARLQTVAENDHKFFYGVLSELNKQNYIPVILNTSFNIRGKPILTTYEDALYVLDNTELDFVVTDQYIITKSK